MGGDIITDHSLTSPFSEQPGRLQAPPPPQAMCPLTLQVVQLPCAMLPRDVLPVGAAGQGYHGVQ